MTRTAMPVSRYQVVAVLYRALLDYAAGHRDTARPLIEQLLAQMRDSQVRHPGLIYQYEPVAAQAAAVLGDREGALSALERSIGTGNHVSGWWSNLNHPAFDQLRDEPRFQALRSRAEAQAAAQRTLLAAMRKDGRVPVQRASVSSGG